MFQVLQGERTPGGSPKPRPGPKPPLTNAERQQRWRDRHAAKLARKASRRGGHTLPTQESLDAMRPTWMNSWLRSFTPTR